MKVCFLDLVKDCPRIKPLNSTFFTHIYKAQRRHRASTVVACPPLKGRELGKLAGYDVDVVFKNCSSEDLDNVKRSRSIMIRHWYIEPFDVAVFGFDVSSHSQSWFLRERYGGTRYHSV